MKHYRLVISLSSTNLITSPSSFNEQSQIEYYQHKSRIVPEHSKIRDLNNNRHCKTSYLEISAVTPSKYLATIQLRRISTTASGAPTKMMRRVALLLLLFINSISARNYALRAKEDPGTGGGPNDPQPKDTARPSLMPTFIPTLVVTGAPSSASQNYSSDTEKPTRGDTGFTDQVYSSLADFSVYLEFEGDGDDSSDILSELDRLTAKHLTSFIKDSDLIAEQKYAESEFGFVSLSIKSFRQGEVEKRQLRNRMETNGHQIRRLNIFYAEATFSGSAIFFTPVESNPSSDELYQVQKDAFSNEEFGLISYITTIRTSPNDLLKTTQIASVSIQSLDSGNLADNNSSEGDGGDNTLLYGGIAAAAAVVIVAMTIVYVWHNRKTPKTIYTRDTTDVSAIQAPEQFIDESRRAPDRYEGRFQEETESVLIETQSVMEAQSVMSYDYSMDGFSLVNRTNTRQDDDMSLFTDARGRVPNLDESSHGSITLPDAPITTSKKHRAPAPAPINHQASMGHDSVFAPSVASYVDDAELGQDDGSVWTYSNVGGNSPPAQAPQPPPAQNQQMPPSILKSSSQSSISPSDKKKILNIGRPVAQMSMKNSMSMKNRGRSHQTVESLDPSLMSLESTDLEPIVVSKNKRYNMRQKAIDEGLYDVESHGSFTSTQVRSKKLKQNYKEPQPKGSKWSRHQSQRRGPPSDVPSDEQEPLEQNLDNFNLPAEEKKNSLGKSGAIDDLDKLSKLIEDRQKSLRKIRRDRR